MYNDGKRKKGKVEISNLGSETSVCSCSFCPCVWIELLRDPSPVLIPEEKQRNAGVVS